jgi:ankyrin repeat protein
MPFPVIQDWNTLRIKLSRTGCYGTCPGYSVELHGDGQVLFEGGGNVLIAGHHRGQISKERLAGLVAAFRDADYFSAKDEYVSDTTDLPTFTTSIEFDGHKKAVKDYDGYRVGIPEAVAKLERKIDQAADTDKWIIGTSETGPALVAENWDFRSHSIQNRELFATVLNRGPKQLIQFFIQQGAPALDPPEKGLSPLAVAASRGDSALVKQLIGTRRDLSPALLACALLGAASGGDLRTVRLVLDYGARVNGPLCDNSDPIPVLLAAALSGNPNVVHEILKYHPDVNARGPNGQTALCLFLERGLHREKAAEIVTSLVAAGADVNIRGEYNGETPLFHVCEFPQLVPVLVKAGADVNAQNDHGENALSSCDDHDYLYALIAAGADISHRDRMGRTAADWARQMGDEETARFLEAASKARKHIQ